MDFPDDDDDLLSVMEHLDEQTASHSNEDTTQQPPQCYLDCLKNKFGHTRFRPSQWKIIRSILDDRRDNCVVMSTGYGKSLCFQFPSVYTGGITVVVSPLISLMQDQVLALTVANIPACFLGSAQTDRTILDGVMNGEYRLVYLSPEYLSSSLDWLVELADRLTLVAIDEAHCVSQWGHDFRQCYRSLGRIRKQLPRVPILTVTATATQRVREDICSSLGLRNAQKICTGFDRPNLEFIVRPKTSVWEDLRSFVRANAAPTGSIIVYCLTRKMVESVAETLKGNGVVCEAYHAGLSVGRRTDIHERFVRDKLQVIVATVAFGMGIDKPDVRLVIHYGASKDIESYYQEVGRAGRDGLAAKCVMFQSNADFDTHMKLRAASILSSKMSERMDKLAKEMKKFVRSDQCRRLVLLQYFEGDSATCEPRPNCCDNCRRPKVSSSVYEGMNDNGQFDFTEETKLLLEAVDLFNGYCGLGKPIAVLRGSQNNNISRYHGHALHGRGKFKSDAYWRQLAEMLENEDMLAKSRKSVPGGYPYPVIEVTRAGSNWLRDCQPLWMKPNQQMMQFMRKKYVASVVDGPTNSNLRITDDGVSPHDQLVSALMVCRTILATRFDVMPYMITSNLALQQLAKAQPLNLAELEAANIDGMSEAKVRQFGDELIKCILMHKNFIKNQTTIEVDDHSMVSLLRSHPMPDVRLTECHLKLLPLTEAEASISIMCTALNLKESTVTQYLVILIKSGYPLKRSYIERLTKLSSLGSAAILAILPTDTEALLGATLRPLKDALPSYLQYDQIKLMLAYAQVRQHLRSLNLQFDDPDSELTVTKTNSIGDATSSSISTPIAENTEEVFDSDDELNDLNVLELLEDNRFPMPPTNGSQTSNLSNNEPLDVDWGSDFDDETIVVDTHAKSQTSNTINTESSQLSDTSTNCSDISPPVDKRTEVLLVDDSDDALINDCVDENKLLLNDKPKNVFQSQDDSLLAQLPDESSSYSQKNAPKRGVAAQLQQSKRIKYDSDSDDDDGGYDTRMVVQAQPATRKLPEWMLKKPAAQPAKKVQLARKRTHLF